MGVEDSLIPILTRRTAVNQKPKDLKVWGVVSGALLFAVLGEARTPRSDAASQVSVRLSEWKVELSRRTIAAGTVTFAITNSGSIPHGFEVEGGGIEKEIETIQPGASDTLTLTLKPGTYEVYCPVGEDSHKKLGMDTHLQVGGEKQSGAVGYGGGGMGEPQRTAERAQAIQVTGGGPVIQILPGPFPFPDSAAPILKAFGDEREGLESQVKNGPYSNNVVPSSGTFTFAAWDKGATRDSVDGVAEFTTQDGARWKLVMDRVQTKDVPHHPRFGGVIMGLYYHGVTQVHTPLVPTINSAVALWAFGHLYKNDALVTDNAMVHVMLLSRTRRDGDFALACWDCSKNKLEELQLQILPGPGEPKFDAPGGFLFVNWEKSSSRALDQTR
jgi:plastocyanin